MTTLQRIEYLKNAQAALDEQASEIESRQTEDKSLALFDEWRKIIDARNEISSIVSYLCGAGTKA